MQAEKNSRKLRKELARIEETLGTLEANHLLQRIGAAQYRAVISKIEEEKRDVEDSLRQEQLAIETQRDRKQWLHWVEQSIGTSPPRENLMTLRKELILTES